MKQKYSERRGSSIISFRLLAVITITSCLLSSKSLPSLFASASDASVNVISSPSSPREFSTLSSPTTPPFITGRVLTNGIIQDVPHDKVILDAGLGEMTLADVIGCCSTSLSSSDGCSGDDDADAMKRVIIGKMPQFTSHQSLITLQSAISAWDGGSGTWPQMTLGDRIKAVQTFIQHLQSKRSEIVTALMYEIGKNQLDAESEFDRTMQFTKQVIEYIQSNAHSEFGSDDWDASHGSTRLFMKRAAIGIVLCLGPYNYPLNETYATLIPALLMGNIILLKIPTVGGLSHLLTMEAFHKSFPPGTINFISGAGRVTMPPLMKSGRVDALAFIGASSAADRLIKDHPEPHRLKVFLQLEAKNMGVYLSNLFDDNKGKGEEEVDWEIILKETIAGTLSYNGQRCTALKLLFVPKDKSEGFASMLAERVENLHVGLPWETKENPKDGTFTYPQITPLPNRGRVEYMQALIQDAVSKGARVMNKNGGMIIGDQDESTLMVPAVLYPVTPSCRLYTEEQFGPVIPIAPYESLAEVITYGKDGKYGQQVSIFTSTSNHINHAKESKAVADLIDRFSTVFGKININAQCGRSPDAAPFSGRRSSAMGVMSVSHALQEFSVPTLVSYKDVGTTKNVIAGAEVHSNFLTTL